MMYVVASKVEMGDPRAVTPGGTVRHVLCCEACARNIRDGSAGYVSMTAAPEAQQDAACEEAWVCS